MKSAFQTLTFAGIALTTAIVWQSFLSSLGVTGAFSYVTSWLVGYGAVIALQGLPKLKPQQVKRQHKRSEAKAFVVTLPKTVSIDAGMLKTINRIENGAVIGEGWSNDVGYRDRQGNVKRPTSSATSRPYTRGRSKLKTKQHAKA